MSKIVKSLRLLMMSQSIMVSRQEDRFSNLHKTPKKVMLTEDTKTKEPSVDATSS